MKKPIETTLKLGMSRNSHNEVVLSIRDDSSGDRILEARMSLENAALFLTGLHGVGADGNVYDTSHVGLEREITSAYVDKRSFNKQDMKDAVLDDFVEKGYAVDDWSIKDDGTTSQQNGNQHRYTLIRYV